MTKSKVLDLAREVGIEDDKLLLKLRRMGVKVKDKKHEEPEKQVSPSDEKIIERDSEKEIVEKRVKPTVIRRRARTLEVKVEAAPPPVMPVEAVIIPEVVEEKVPKARDEKAEPERKVPKKAAEKEEELEKEEQPSVKPVRAKKKKEASQEATPAVKARAEEKEVIPLKLPSKKPSKPRKGLKKPSRRKLLSSRWRSNCWKRKNYWRKKNWGLSQRKKVLSKRERESKRGCWRRRSKEKNWKAKKLKSVSGLSDRLRERSS